MVVQDFVPWIGGQRQNQYSLAWVVMSMVQHNPFDENLRNFAYGLGGCIDSVPSLHALIFHPNQVKEDNPYTDFKTRNVKNQ